jgi:nickel superoxide dismutase
MGKTAFKRILLSAVTILGLVFVFMSTVYGHCQVPCGIYNDHARITQMLEDSATVLKASRQITSLSGKTDAQSRNQLVRWVMNKEKHAQNVISTICDYFLTQRIKPGQTDYVERLKRHHAVIIAAMKAKQHADEKMGLALQKTIEALAHYYPSHK